jgi:hypothetical protein
VSLIEQLGRTEQVLDAAMETCSIKWSMRGLVSSGGIATRYEFKGPGLNTSKGHVFRTNSDWHLGRASLLYNGYRVIPGGKTYVSLRSHPLHLDPSL